MRPTDPDQDSDTTSGGEQEQPDTSDVDVTSADEVDPSDGTDADDLPVDNPAG